MEAMDRLVQRTLGNNTMPTISVIVPVYKAEKFLGECIKSILNQTFSDFELLLVDDGSPDGSGEICDEYAKRDARIKVVHQQNLGANAARKSGVKKARGEWVTFCDADDTLTASSLEEMYKEAEGTDIVIGFLDKPKCFDQLTLEECRKEIIKGSLIPPTPFAKLFRKSILNEDIFNFPREIVMGEDMLMNIRLLFQVNRSPHFVFKKVYNYRRNTASVSHSSVATLAYEKLFDQLRIASISKDVIGNYMHCVIYSRLNGLLGVAYDSPNDICYSRSDYLRQLKTDIKVYHYKCTVREWMILHLRPAILLRSFAFLLKAWYFTIYHLGLR